MATERLSALISSLGTTVTSSESGLSNAIGAVPGGSAKGQFSAGTSASSSAYVEYYFDLSSVPENAEIDSVSCTAGGYTPSGGYYTAYTAQLYSGSTAKGSSGNLKSSTVSNTDSFDGGTWTRDELDDCRIQFAATKSQSGSSKLCYITGAQITVTYTYNSEKFMLKTGGAWGDVSRVFKKVPGIWVEQTDLSSVVDTDKRLFNGGEITS